MKSRETLGAEVPALVEVDCGSVTAQVDSENVLRVPHVPKGSLFSVTERDLLLYHDIDLALFHNNLQKNVALRVQSWQTNRKPTTSVNSPSRSISSKMVVAGA